MATNTLEEKIEKIRLQNEKIRQRYEEVEADKKNAAKLNALVQLVPSDDWPERKEPPEFSAPPRNPPTQKNVSRDHDDRLQKSGGAQERLTRREHKYNQGEGPPPDPKYNFLADSERESRSSMIRSTDEDNDRSQNKNPRNPGRRGRGGRDGGNVGNRSGGPGGDFIRNKDAFFKDNRGPNAFCSRDGSVPEYEAWRAERNRIDEARINRQKTAEGNWRREWDCNKVNVEKEAPKRELNKRDFGNQERRPNYRDNYSEDDHVNRYGESRTFRGSQRSHGFQDSRRPQDQFYDKKQSGGRMSGPSIDGRSVTATDRSIKVTVSPNNQSKGSVMSVKVNSPNIAGTGRVGPRQKSRLSYSSQSDAEANSQNINNPSSETSLGGDEYVPKKLLTKSPSSPRKKRGDPRSANPQQNQGGIDESVSQTAVASSPHPPPKDQRKPRVHKKIQKMTKNDIKSSSDFDNAIPSQYCSNNSADQNVEVDEHSSENSENVFVVSSEPDSNSQQTIHSSDNLQVNDNPIDGQFDNPLEEIGALNSSDDNSCLRRDGEVDESTHDASGDDKESNLQEAPTTDSLDTSNHADELEVHHEPTDEVQEELITSKSEFSHDDEVTSDELPSLNDVQPNNQEPEEISYSSQSTDLTPPLEKDNVPMIPETQSICLDEKQMDSETINHISVEDSRNNSTLVDNEKVEKEIPCESASTLVEENIDCQAESSKETSNPTVVSEKSDEENHQTEGGVGQFDLESSEKSKTFENEAISDVNSNSNTKNEDNALSGQLGPASATDSSLNTELGSTILSEMKDSVSEASNVSEKLEETIIRELGSSRNISANDSGFSEISASNENTNSEDSKKTNIKELVTTDHTSENDEKSSNLVNNPTESKAESTVDQILKDNPVGSIDDAKEISEKSPDAFDAAKVPTSKDSCNVIESDSLDPNAVTDSSEKSGGQSVVPEISSVEQTSGPIKAEELKEMTDLEVD